MRDVEAAFFRDLVDGVVREQLKIDPLIDKQLAEGWRLTRVDSILRAILRAGAYEILMRSDVPGARGHLRICRHRPCLLRRGRAQGRERHSRRHCATKRARRSSPPKEPAMADRAERVERRHLGEFELIARYFAPLADEAAALALRDDAAVLWPSPRARRSIATCDTSSKACISSPTIRPTPSATRRSSVNLSDLAAKGARGLRLSAGAGRRGATPRRLGSRPSPPVCASFSRRAGICLVGGDTTATPGPLTITITALGLVPARPRRVAARRQEGRPALCQRHASAMPALGLRLLKDPALARAWDLSEQDRAFLIDRYRRPEPRTELVIPVRNFAQGAIDVSDGLVGDIEKLAHVSHVGAVIETAHVPFSPAARKALQREPRRCSQRC